MIAKGRNVNFVHILPAISRNGKHSVNSFARACFLPFPMVKYRQVNGSSSPNLLRRNNSMDFIKTLIDQILGLIKTLGSDNNTIAKVIDALKNVLASVGKEEE